MSAFLWGYVCVLFSLLNVFIKVNHSKFNQDVVSLYKTLFFFNKKKNLLIFFLNSPQNMLWMLSRNASLMRRSNAYAFVANNAS